MADRTLIDALLMDADEHADEGRVSQAANARAAAENLRGAPPWGSPCWPRLGSAALVVRDGQLLMGRRAKDPGRGQWVPPGGRVKPAETLAQAAERELLEETGLVIRVTGRPGAAGVFELVDDEQHRVVVYSRAEVLAGVLQAGDDLDDVRFFRRHELSGLNLSGISAEVLRANGWLS